MLNFDKSFGNQEHGGGQEQKEAKLERAKGSLDSSIERIFAKYKKVAENN